jgi:molybdopterin/thiamine biosynthesis adenylyltransferase
VAVETREVRLTAENGAALLAGHDLVLDGSDTFETRSLVATASEALRLPLVAGAVSGWDGQLTVFLPGGKRFTDLHPVAPAPGELPSCEVAGVLGPVTGIIGTLMAMEAIKLLTGVGEPLSGRVLLYDGRSARFTELAY